MSAKPILAFRPARPEARASAAGEAATRQPSQRESAAVVRIEDAYLPLIHLADYSGLSVRTLRGYLTHPAHPLPCYRVGGKVLVRRSEFDAWAQQFRSAPASAVEALVADAVKGLCG